MADDSSAPLPRRVPGTNRHGPGSEQEARPTGPTVLPEDVVRRIRVALDAARTETALQEDAPGPEAADRATGPTSVPPWELGTSQSPEPPAAITARPATADRPERAVTVPADPEPTPAPQPTAPERPDRHDGPGEGMSHRAKVPARGRDGRTRRAKPLARRIKLSAQAPKPAPPHQPSPSPGPVPQMALMFPPEPASEEITIRPLAPIMPERGRRPRAIGWIILVLVLVVIAAVVFLL